MLTNYGKLIYKLALGGGSRFDENEMASYQVTNVDGNSQYISLYTTILPSPRTIDSAIFFGTDASLNEDMYTLTGKNYWFFVCRDTQGSYPVEVGDISTQAFVLENNTDSDLTYTCFGRATGVGDSSSSGYRTYLMTSAFMLDEPVTVPAHGTKTVEIKFDYSNL